ncbi:AbrB/MazE/SpoVT family DNA-binding domain-containing protein [Candidatus Woesearchaeota archaeon]|nr:AbrB/MazE/SpoVT family DNA-binding domain-containing protein [Candidatus Woesearchaeota archaeon]
MKENDIELVKMSEKGQLVVPQEIRESSNLSPGERFVAFPIQNGVLFKKVDMPKVKLDFESLAKDIESQFKKNKVKESDVEGAIKWARKR